MTGNTQPAGAIHELSSPVSAKQSPIRVLHFHSSKGLYGPERWTHLALRTADPTRLAAEVLTIGTKPGYDDFARFLRIQGFTAHHLAIGGTIGLEAVRTIRKLLKERQIQVLHTHGFKSDILGFFAVRGLNCGLVTTPHGWCDHESLRIRAYETLGRVFLRGFDRVYPLSAHQMTFLARHRLGKRVRLIRNAVDIAAFDEIREERRQRPSRENRVLFIGRLCREKGLLDLVDAIGIVARDLDVQATMLGDGPARDAAIQRATALGVGDRVTFLGFRDDIRPFLREASVLCLPSYAEGIPRVVMEAFAAGVPVVGTDIPGLRELIASGVNGWLAPVGDTIQLASALDAALRDPSRANGMAERARAVVERDHSPERLDAELMAEYETIVGRLT